MEAKGLFTVGKNVMLPMDTRARDIMATLKPGDRVLVKVHRARNPEHNALAHVVFDRIAKATGHSIDEVKLFLKAATGRVDFVRLPNGKVIAAPRSLKFESMSQDEFQQFWDECLPIICEQILPDLPKREFEELREIIAGKLAA
jgi:hypothetical protein